MSATAPWPTITLDALEADPYPIYRHLRDEAPVCWVESVGLWLVTRWDDVRRVVLDDAAFTAEIDDSPLTRTLGRHLMHADAAFHDAVRRAVEAPFRPAAVRGAGAALIAHIAADLLGAFAADGAADLMAAFAEPLSVRTLAAVLGVGELPEADLRRWFNELAAGGSNFERDPAKQATGDRASREVDAAVAPLLDRLARQPDGSVLSLLQRAEVAGRRLAPADVCANLKLMILGGMQEPRDLIGLALVALLAESTLYRRVADDSSVDRRLVEEALRWGTPVGTVTRQTRQAVELGGVTIPAGARVAAVVASANRDERHWSEPDRFDVDRAEGPNLAFGLGGHFCLGSWLARYEAMLGLRALFDRLPNLRLDPDRPPAVRGWEFRGPTTLHVRWDA